MARLTRRLRVAAPLSPSHPPAHPGSAGQGLSEYALIISLVSLVVLVTLVLLGDGVKGVFCNLMVTFDPETPETCLVEISADQDQPGDTPAAIEAMAGYRRSDQTLAIVARVPDGTSPTLTVAGFGVMSRIAGTNLYKLIVTTSNPPQTVIIHSSDGGSFTVPVRGS